ncbi:MAG: YgfZ/GcvT domain-containing protein [Planctomycetaceae bacterium]
MSASLRFQRILVTGRDRAKFLHNFCTNAVRDLPEGRSVEAFFVDVKARVLAHGYVLSLPSRHEIHVLGSAGAETALLKHLDRYIITEDVQVRGVSEGEQGALWRLPAVQSADAVPSCAELPGIGVRHVFRWSSGVMCVLAGGQQAVSGCLGTDAEAATDELFLNWQIAERYPLVGVDISGEHLAPEADRNRQAISFHKGCYLGQEPIARIDAMGHINRALRRVLLSGLDAADGRSWAGAELRSADGALLGSLTSVQPETGSAAGAGLAVVKLSGVPAVAVRGDGKRCVVAGVEGSV